MNLGTVDFLRHAQTDFNCGLDPASKDIGVNERGKMQCSQTQLPRLYDVVICSPMRRCRQTLALCAIQRKETIISHLCREHKTDPCDFFDDEDVDDTETEEELLLRVDEFKVFLHSLCGKSVLVVSHGDFIWYLTSHIVQGERFGHRVENCQLLQWPWISI